MKFTEYYFEGHLKEASYGIGDNVEILNPLKYNLKPSEAIGFVRGFGLQKGGLANVPGYGIGPDPSKKVRGLKIELRNGKEIFIDVENIKKDLHKIEESEAKAFVNEVRLLIEAEVDSIGIDPAFTSKLCNYLEKRFPNYGDFDLAVGNEIRQYMKGENTYVKKVKQRIHDIINKAKQKLLRDVQNKVDKIKILPKEKSKPPSSFGPVTSDNPMAGENPPNVNQ
jgi:hypothetical protein